VTAVTTRLRLDGQDYLLRADMRLIAEIEDELGALPVLSARFSTGLWRVTDLVTAVQIALQAQGATFDFYELGDLMLQEGIDACRDAVARLLCGITDCFKDSP
jgi:hypothetical protein